MTLISIPRDTKVEYQGETMKINAAHTYGGAAGMVEAVSDLCGVDISHYAEISFDGMVQLVDALGGVEVNVPDKIDDPKAGEMAIEPGLQTLDGARRSRSAARAPLPTAITRACAISVSSYRPSRTRFSTRSMQAIWWVL